MAPTLTKKKRDAADDALTPGTSPATGPLYTWPSPAKPSAFLVPTYVRENRAYKRTRKQVVAAVAATALLCAAGIAALFVLNTQAAADLAEAESARAAAQAKVDALSDVADYYDGLEQRRAATVQHLSKDLMHAAMVRTVLDALPKGAALTGYKTDIGGTCLGPDPFEPANALGCIEIVGVAPSEASVPQMLDNLAARDGKEPLLDSAFATNVTNENVAKDAADSKASYRFSMTIRFTPEALSLRYVPADSAEAAEATAAPTTEETP